MLLARFVHHRRRRVPRRAAGEPIQTLDLVELKELRIFPHNVEDHEELIRRIFALLSGAVTT